MEEIGLGILIGVGLAYLGRKVVRPALRSTIKAGLIASEAARDALYEGKEVLSDVVAEARHEWMSARRAAAAAKTAPPIRPEEPKGHVSDAHS
jgi:hypothetical protein